MKFIIIGLASLATLFTSCTLARIVPNPFPCPLESVGPFLKSKGRIYNTIPQSSSTNLQVSKTNGVSYKSWNFIDGAKQFTGSIGNDGSLQITVLGQTYEYEIYYIGIQFGPKVKAYYRINGNSNCKSAGPSKPGDFVQYNQVTAIDASLEVGRKN